MEEEGGLIGDVCVCVCVWSTASASCISITNRAARPVMNTAIFRYCKLQFITTVGTVQCATFSVGLRAICGKSNVRWGGYLPLRELMWWRDGDRPLVSRINWGTKRKRRGEACYNTLWRIRLARHVAQCQNGKCIQNFN
jgi:hypothetical protein